MKQNQNQSRQGDVLVTPCKKPSDALTALPVDKEMRIVLAHGEITGHAHAVYDYAPDMAAELALVDAAEMMAAESVARIMGVRLAQLWADAQGEWFLEVRQPCALSHEEHIEISLTPGWYYLPVQVQETSGNMPRRVAD